MVEKFNYMKYNAKIINVFTASGVKKDGEFFPRVDFTVIEYTDTEGRKRYERVDFIRGLYLIEEEDGIYVVDKKNRKRKVNIEK
jgi:hypothetical protein